MEEERQNRTIRGTRTDGEELEAEIMRADPEDFKARG
jgi:hypothetical protein